jgi:protein-tyrosine-phosphatase
VRVLFLCTGNSARSQIAEAFTRARSLGRVAAVSAGSHPKPLHPNAIRVMAEHGINLGRHRSKHVDLYAGQRFDYVISLCDKVREVCPDFDGRPEVIHWSISDPAATSDADDANYPAFEAVAADLATRVDFLLAAINDSRSRDPRGRRND